MSLNAAEKITLSEITGESIASISAVTVDADLETKLRTEITTWNDNRNDVELIISGSRDGVDLQTQRLLSAITRRVRVWLDFPEQKSITSSLPGSVVVSSSVRW